MLWHSFRLLRRKNPIQKKMQSDYMKLYQVCEEPAPFGIKIGTSVERGLKSLRNGKKSRFFIRVITLPFRLLVSLFQKNAF